jgi:hypothetical protein
MLGNPEGMTTPGRPRREWKMMLKWNLNKCDGKLLTAFNWLGVGKNFGFL